VTESCGVFVRFRAPLQGNKQIYKSNSSGAEIAIASK
jgi:hypothetical protein